MCEAEVKLRSLVTRSCCCCVCCSFFLFLRRLCCTRGRATAAVRRPLARSLRLFLPPSSPPSAGFFAVTVPGRDSRVSVCVQGYGVCCSFPSARCFFCIFSLPSLSLHLIWTSSHCHHLHPSPLLPLRHLHPSLLNDPSIRRLHPSFLFSHTFLAFLSHLLIPPFLQRSLIYTIG